MERLKGLKRLRDERDEDAFQKLVYNTNTFGKFYGEKQRHLQDHSDLQSEC
ncbi:MAG: hypothetical protein GQ527_13000 [Bacteroidales bacterium]|nr:hypothetical protein [Bacteroidales bacterium]